MGCSGGKAIPIETQPTSAGEYEEMLRIAQAQKAGVQDMGQKTSNDLMGGIAKFWKLGNVPKNPKEASSANSSTPVLMDDGSKYLGEWRDGKKHGKGKQLFRDGTVFIGTWNNGIAEGECTLEVGGPKLDSGIIPKFTGHVKNNMADGPGNFLYGDGSSIKGTWINDEKNGFFEETWSDGTLFKGTYVDGKKDGLGYQIWPDRSVYFGEFVQDEINGWGRYQWNDGRVVRAQWKWNLMSGYGHFCWEDGRVYKGEYVEGKKDGFGVFTWPDGRASRGYWKNSQLHGLNYMTNQKGHNKWTLHNNGTRERFVDSAEERAAILREEGLTENGPQFPAMPVWLEKLPPSTIPREQIEAEYAAFNSAAASNYRQVGGGGGSDKLVDNEGDDTPGTMDTIVDVVDTVEVNEAVKEVHDEIEKTACESESD